MRIRKDMVAIICTSFWIEWRCPYCCAAGLAEGAEYASDNGFLWQVFYCDECNGDFAVRYERGGLAEVLAFRPHPHPTMEDDAHADA